ncbi:T6SS immunity protein Tdi1 domain-containing protein [Propionispora vibrioides]|uniref:T6SS immunity protein Tdi1 C-terminal domain-containing protein n=1 Tax=Propionispora vibrioides TaxID=112903 RepID=A0A1H8XBY3_9FIRM|nr:T6SS immunity protein Tdi1 domain-containing protein [Propionispora vibrioides]SEP36788.1 protein of unknown function [Propionispora vibrioides]
MMFEKFCSEFKVNVKNEEPILLSEELEMYFNKSNGAIEFLRQYSGETFKEGLYRIHKTDQIAKWNAIIKSAFPEVSKNIICFSYDWLGRHFAIDFGRLDKNEPLILMLEPGTGEALEIPATFMSFHEEELVEYQEAVLATEFFKQWKEQNEGILLPNKCIGYKVPLFLGGEDSLVNLEMNDMEVYWEICGQLLNKVRNLPSGTKMEDIIIS